MTWFGWALVIANLLGALYVPTLIGKPKTPPTWTAGTAVFVLVQRLVVVALILYVGTGSLP